ncbi:MAG: MFS transporter [Alphaproteobacteria bacterium]|nr:MAG: MFS transporter [Alphaproteobacteria bacterium]
MTSDTTQTASSPQEPSSPWAPFRHASFRVMWTATVVANVGTWMYNAASGWLMTSLDPDPLIVALVQVATTLPIFLLALPAGALADIVDRRRFLLVLEVATTAFSALFAAFVSLDLVTPGTLLLFAFLIGASGALTAPAWQAIVPQLVPAQDLAPAISANSVGFNISRAIGPALGGAIIAGFGIAAPFWLNAISNLGVLGALWWWRSPQASGPRLPAERVGNAMIAGLRYARHNAHLRATLMRAAGFFLVGSAYWALLPLVARNQVAGGPELYGILLGAIGTGAVGGAFLLPKLKASLGADRLVAAGTLGTAVALVLFGLAHDVAIALLASFIAGAAWIAALASLNVSAQVALPEWVRGRGLALYMTVFFGALSVGSIIWGKLAGLVGLPAAHFAAGAAALAVIPLGSRWKLQTGAKLDLTPSLHWPAPVTTIEIEHDRGPVLVTVEYRIRITDRNAFLAALDQLSRERRRDGAYRWGLFEDAAEEGRFVETFVVESWLEHLRQHQRVTQADRLLQDAIVRFQTAGAPKVTHWLAAQAESPTAIH